MPTEPKATEEQLEKEHNEWICVPRAEWERLLQFRIDYLDRLIEERSGEEK